MSEKDTLKYIARRILEYAKAATDEGPHADHSRTDPFKGSGLVFIHQPSFRKWVGQKYHFYVSQPQAMTALAMLRAQPRLLNFKNKFGRKVYGINITTDPMEESLQQDSIRN